MKEGKKDEANEIKNKVAELKTADKELQDKMEKAQADMTNLLLTIPNIPNEDVPEGKDASDNVVVKEGGENQPLKAKLFVIGTYVRCIILLILISVLK